MIPTKQLLKASLAVLLCALLSAPTLHATPESTDLPSPSKSHKPPKPTESTQTTDAAAKDSSTSLDTDRAESSAIDSGASPIEPALDSPVPEKSAKSKTPHAKSKSPDEAKDSARAKPIAKPASSSIGISRIFIGMGGGVVLQDHISQDSPALQHLHPALSITLRGGYEHEFFGAMPLRLYLDYMVGIAPVGIESTITSNFLLNADVSYYHRVLENLRLGVFAGLGLGYGTYGKEVKEDPSASDSILAKGFVMFANAGLGAEIDRAHRLEALLKFPIVKLDLAPDRTYQELHVLFAYSYLF